MQALRWIVGTEVAEGGGEPLKTPLRRSGRDAEFVPDLTPGCVRQNPHPEKAGLFSREVL